MFVACSLLLEIQGYSDSQITDAYETALSTLHGSEDLKLLWLRYASFLVQEVMLVKLSQSEKTSLTEYFRYLQYKYELVMTIKTQECFKVFADLVHRCLMTMPSKFPLPLSPNKYWLDFSFHNKVIEFFCSCLPSNKVLSTLEKYASRMPQNVVLIQR